MNKKDKTIISIQGKFNKAFEPYTMTDEFVGSSIKNRFAKELRSEELLGAMELTIGRFKAQYDNADEIKKGNIVEVAIKYFCGICWSTIRPYRQFGNMWVALSEKIKGRVIWYQEGDLVDLEGYNSEYIRKTMIKALTTVNSPNQGYWSHFIDLINEDNNKSGVN